jgi:hypothetical protein
VPRAGGKVPEGSKIVQRIICATEIYSFMKRLILLALAGFAVAISDVRAGSAVAIAPHNQMVMSYGHPVEVAKQRALELARRKYGRNVRIWGATDKLGYSSIAKARHPNGYGWIVAAALGKTSAREANNSAIEHCRSLGGKNPEVISTWNDN